MIYSKGNLIIASRGGVCLPPFDMDVYEAIHSRASVRDYTGEEVPQGAVERILSAAVRAPTAGNLQPWRFFVVRDRAVRRLLAGAALGQAFVERAPLVIVVCADLEVCARGYGSRGESLYSIQDTAAAVENILLCATAEGLGACWVGAFDEDMVCEALSLPGSLRPLAPIPLGRPAARPALAPRRSFRECTKSI